ncbi:MAG: hypothetical protein K2X99_10100 [Gemmatimonadaceae bacterium]|nr:hypothetical protein [Gemmatimonadaceae bacterium]
MSSAREHAVEAARRWPLWFGMQMFIGFYGVNALLDQVLALVGATGWEHSPVSTLASGVGVAVAVTVLLRSAKH